MKFLFRMMLVAVLLCATSPRAQVYWDAYPADPRTGVFAPRFYYPPYLFPPPPTIVVPPPTPVQPPPPPALPTQQPSYWYCFDAKAYYPDITKCNGGWQQVVPRAPPPPPPPS